MKKLILAICVVLAFGAGQSFENSEKTPGLSSQYFIENKGQWNASVLYLVRMNGMDTWITKTGVTYNFYSIEDNKTDFREWTSYKFENRDIQLSGHVVNVNHMNCNTQPTSKGRDKHTSYVNYFIGKDSENWTCRVGLYKEATIEQIYDGIDQHWYFDGNNLRYDYLVAPGADYSQIQLYIDGAIDYSIKNNDLVFNTDFGEVKQTDLFVYQVINGNKKSISACWEIKYNHISLKLGDYLQSAPLVIDPLIYSTFLGRDAADYSNSIKVGSNDYTYISGYSLSTDFPVTVGAYQISLHGNQDVFISKLNPTGTSLVYSTFLGGSGGDHSYSIAIDDDENVYVSGSTNSTDYPVTQGAFQVMLSGLYDAFVSKLNSSGTDLVYSTFLGGSDEDHTSSIQIDASGNAYISGATSSADFPVSAGAFQEQHGGGYNDVFVTKLNPTGNTLVYSTYLGGALDDYPASVAINSIGNAYVTGRTHSTDFPTTTGALQISLNGMYDGFVTKLNENGTDLEYSTYLGGDIADDPSGITVDSSENAYITGITNSLNYPVTHGAYQERPGGSYDIFVSKINPEGNVLLYSTYMGGNNDDYSNDITIDSNGSTYITGFTISNDFPVTAGSYQESLNGKFDAFVSKFNLDGTVLLYSTFLGGSEDDYSYSVDIDTKEDVYITGITYSDNFPVTEGVYEENPGNYQSIFVCKLGMPTVLLVNPGIELNIKVYPNPVATHIWVWMKGYEPSEARVKLFNLQGHLLMEQHLNGTNTQMDVNFMRPGVYFWQVWEREYMLGMGKLIKL